MALIFVVIFTEYFLAAARTPKIRHFLLTICDKSHII